MSTNQRNSGMDQRRAARYPVAGAVVHGDGKGKVRDMSATGIYFESKRNFKVAELARLVVAVGKFKARAKDVVDNCLRLDGRVVRSQLLESGRYGIAVEFEHIRFCGPTPLDDLGRHLAAV